MQQIKGIEKYSEATAISFSLSTSKSSEFSATTDSNENQKDHLDITVASGVSPPGRPDSDSFELEPDSDSQDSVELDSGSLPDPVLLDKNPSSYCQMREGAMGASIIVDGRP